MGGKHWTRAKVSNDNNNNEGSFIHKELQHTHISGVVISGVHVCVLGEGQLA